MIKKLKEIFHKLLLLVMTNEKIKQLNAIRCLKFCNNKVNVNGGGNSILLIETSILKNCNIEVLGKNCKVNLGNDNKFINCNIQIFGDNCEISLGTHNICENVWFWCEDCQSKIKIQHNNLFTGRIQLASIEGTKIEIGSDNLFSRDIQISTGDSHSMIDINTGIRINPSKNIIIKNHVWIGMHTTICKGVEIADNVIVGRGAILTHSVETPNVAVAGVPAKIIKSGITWNFERIPIL